MNSPIRQEDLFASLSKLEKWIVANHYSAYDTFDGLSSPLAPFVTWNIPFLKQIWQQGVRRFPLNLRPLLGIRPGTSTKGMGFFAQGYLRLYQTYRDPVYLERMNFCLDWLTQHRSPGFQGFCWGNHFDYESRGGNIAKGTPTIVWTGLIGHAFLDAYDFNGQTEYLDVARSACEFIVNELGWMEMGEGVCLRYFPHSGNEIHNSNMIGASLLARVNRLAPNPRWLELAERAVYFTVSHQTGAGAWAYGVGPRWAWVDSFHTGYVLEALDIFCRCSGSDRFQASLEKGYAFFVKTFFHPNGMPRYYDHKTMPIDIQCASQGIETLVNLERLHPDSLAIATRVAEWTIRQMQDRTGYFYYRKYPLITNKTPTLHWGQATMLAALATLDHRLKRDATTTSSIARDCALAGER